MPDKEKKLYLYRYFDKDGVLLYVGKTCNKEARHLQHKSKSPWFADHTKVTYRRYKHEKSLRCAEFFAIIDELPLHNKAENPNWKRPKKVELRLPLSIVTKWRERKNLSYEDLAAAVGMDAETIEKMESKEYDPRISEVQRIVAYSNYFLKYADFI